MGYTVIKSSTGNHKMVDRIPAAESFQIDNDHLVVFDQDNYQLAAYRAEQWISIARDDKATPGAVDFWSRDTITSEAPEK